MFQHPSHLTLDPFSKKHTIWKDIAMATIPELIALTLQKLLEEAFDYWKSKQQQQSPKNCKCNDQETDGDDEHSGEKDADEEEATVARKKINDKKN